MKLKLRTILGAAALVALAVPMSASSHPSIFEIVGKLAKAPEIQTITIDATGGTFKPSAGAKSVPFNAPAWRVQDALGADPAIGRAASGQANVLVLGNDGGPYTLRFQGTRATTNQDQVVPDPSGLTGGASTAIAATVVQGGLDDIRYQDDPTGASLPDDVVRSVISNDGAVSSLVETNGLVTNGWLNLRFMPGGYRRPAAPGIPMTKEQWVLWPLAQTGIQSHATCQNVPALADVNLVLEVQSNANDPFWNYVPWQKTSAGLGDEPEQWIEPIEDAVAIDLSALNTVDEFRAACESLNPAGGGGVYVPADNPSNPAQGAINEAVAAAVAPLNAMITALQADKTALQAQVADLEGQVATLSNRPLVVRLQAKNSNGKVVAMVTGPLAESTKVTLRLSAAGAKKLKVSRTIASSTKTLGSSGATLVTLTPSKAALRALARYGKRIDITVQATSGSLKAAASGKLGR